MPASSMRTASIFSSVAMMSAGVSQPEKARRGGDHRSGIGTIYPISKNRQNTDSALRKANERPGPKTDLKRDCGQPREVASFFRLLAYPTVNWQAGVVGYATPLCFPQVLLPHARASFSGWTNDSLHINSLSGLGEAVACEEACSILASAIET